MSALQATEPTLTAGIPAARRRHESLESDFAVPPISAPAVTVPDDDDLTADRLVSSKVNCPSCTRTCLHLPTAIATQLVAARTERRLTNGELIIAAIEAMHDRLNDLIHPGEVVGGRIFKARGVGSTSPGKVPTTPVAYSLRASDFEVLDELKRDCAARSQATSLPRR